MECVFDRMVWGSHSHAINEAHYVIDWALSLTLAKCSRVQRPSLHIPSLPYFLPGKEFASVFKQKVKVYYLFDYANQLPSLQSSYSLVIFFTDCPFDWLSIHFLNSHADDYDPWCCCWYLHLMFFSYFSIFSLLPHVQPHSLRINSSHDLQPVSLYYASFACILSARSSIIENTQTHTQTHARIGSIKTPCHARCHTIWLDVIPPRHVPIKLIYLWLWWFFPPNDYDMCNKTFLPPPLWTPEPCVFFKSYSFLCMLHALHTLYTCTPPWTRLAITCAHWSQHTPFQVKIPRDTR